MCQCLASQGSLAKVTLSQHLLGDMTENLVKNGLTCHYSKSLLIWEQILVLDSDCTAAGFCSLVCVYKIWICSLYTQYFLFIYTVDRKYVPIYNLNISLCFELVLRLDHLQKFLPTKIVFHFQTVFSGFSGTYLLLISRSLVMHLFIFLPNICP